MNRLRALLTNARRYPSLAAGLILILFFVILSIYAVIAIPYSEALRLWQAGPGIWDEYPRNARPAWFNIFTRDKLPQTVVVSSKDQGSTQIEPLDGETDRVTLQFPFRFAYDGFPTELNLFITASVPTPMTVSWRTPDNRTISIVEDRMIRVDADTYYISQDLRLLMELGNRLPHIGLLADPAAPDRVLKGDYQMTVMANVPKEAELSARLVVYGQVYGLAGTDHRRRDLMVALLWGAPIGLMFGILAAIGANLSTFVLAGISTWLGGRIEKVFQWITQVNLILPVLPILIMVGYFYSRSIWLMLGLIIALNVFSAGMLTYRAMFLQAKEAPYFEAAQAYGAGNFRIIFRYLLPRIAPTLLPQFVLVVPTFVFLEATLAVLGLGDPVLPTWGKVLNDAYSQGALYKGLYYWMVLPSALLMLMGVGFSLVGFALDRIFNPRLRTV